MWIELAYALPVAAAAGLMRGFAGVGSGMLMAPFFIRLFGPVETVAIIIMMEVVVTAQILPAVYRLINWRVIGPMGLAAMAFMPLGNTLLTSLDPQWIARGVGVLVAGFALVLMAGWRYTGIKPLPATLGVGALSGVLMALTSLGNPPVMLYLLSSQDDAATNRANFTGYFAITLLALIAIMAWYGQLGREPLTTTALLLPVFMFCAWLGARMFRQANEAMYRRVALLILLGAGVFGVLKS